MTAVVLGVAVAVVFGAVGTTKLLALPPMPDVARRLGFTVAAYRRIGLLELCGALGVLVGLRLPWLGLLAALGLVLLLAGGMFFHLKVGDGATHLLVPAGTGLLVVGYALAL